jgi:hypothetical protein
MMGTFTQKLLLLAVLVSYIHGVWGKTEISSITGMKFHQPSAEEMQRAHEAFSSQGLHNQTAMRYVKRSEAKPAAIKPRDVSPAQLQQAKALVAAAQASQAAYNKWNIENPSFNIYRHKKAGEASPQRRDNGMSPPNFSQEILNAIKLVGDVDAQDMHNNGTLPNYDGDTKMKTHTANIDTNFYRNGTSKRASGGGWMGQMQHVGTQPFSGDPSYQVSFTRGAIVLAYAKFSRSGEMSWTSALLGTAWLTTPTPSTGPSLTKPGAAQTVPDQLLRELSCTSLMVSTACTTRLLAPTDSEP